jgi:polyisoprenoid-binding protein YceI
MKGLFRSIIAVLALAATAGVAAAQPSNWKVDAKHSTVSFKVKHFFTQQKGLFNEFEGTVVFDDKNPANIKVDAKAMAASVFTDDEKRDNHLRTADFFDVEKHPEITFKSTKVTAAGKNKYKVTGDFTMRGVTKPVTFDAEFLGAGAVGVGGQAWGTKAGFVATTVINRKDFGINWNKTLDQGGFMLGDEVTIEMNLEVDAVK